jgi:hypothetical protein
MNLPGLRHHVHHPMRKKRLKRNQGRLRNR